MFLFLEIFSFGLLFLSFGKNNFSFGLGRKVLISLFKIDFSS